MKFLNRLLYDFSYFWNGEVESNFDTEWEKYPSKYYINFSVKNFHFTDCELKNLLAGDSTVLKIFCTSHTMTLLSSWNSSSSWNFLTLLLRFFTFLKWGGETLLLSRVKYGKNNLKNFTLSFQSKIFISSLLAGDSDHSPNWDKCWKLDIVVKVYIMWL